MEHYLLHCIRKDIDFVKELDLVLEVNEKIIGHIAYVKSFITMSDSHLPVLTLGPLSIAKEYQHQGYGQLLVNYSLQKAKRLGYKAVCVEGDINFYRHCGFDYASKKNITNGEFDNGMINEYFLYQELEEDYLSQGIYNVPTCYEVNEEEVEKYDQLFPTKKKLKLPHQLF